MATKTWSFLERAEWIFLPVSPNFSVRRNSILECMSSKSSSMVNFSFSMSLTMSLKAFTKSLDSSWEINPTFPNILACAVEAMTSYFAKTKSNSRSFPTVKWSIFLSVLKPLSQSFIVCSCHSRTSLCSALTPAGICLSGSRLRSNSLSILF